MNHKEAELSWFKQEFAKSNIMSGILAIGVWGAIIYLAILQAPIPDILFAGGTTVIAFFFGAKQGQAEGRSQAFREVETMQRRIGNV